MRCMLVFISVVVLYSRTFYWNLMKVCNDWPLMNTMTKYETGLYSPKIASSFEDLN
jgi:hypothetical protein